MPQFFVQIVFSIEGFEQNGFDERWFDTIDQAAEFVKEHDQELFKLITMRMFTGKKPTEDDGNG